MGKAEEISKRYCAEDMVRSCRRWDYKAVAYVSHMQSFLDAQWFQMAVMSGLQDPQAIRAK